MSKLLTHEAAVQTSREVVEVLWPDGETYSFTIRRLGADEMISTGIIPADQVMDTKSVGAAAKQAAREVQAAAAVGKLLSEDLSKKVDAALMRAVIEPRLWDGPEGERPEGYLLLNTIGPARAVLFPRIVRLAGTSKEAQEAARFPDSNRTGRRRAGGRAARGKAAAGTPA